MLTTEKNTSRILLQHFITIHISIKEKIHDELSGT